MKRLPVILFASAALIAASAAVAANAAHAQRRDRVELRRAEAERLRLEADQYRAAYLELVAGLDRLDQIAAQSRDRRARIRLGRALQDLRARADSHLTAQPALPAVQPIAPQEYAPPEPVYVSAPQAMSAQEFATLRDSLRNVTFAKSQLRLLEEAAPHNWFTVDQVIELMGVVGFASTQVDVAAVLYPRLIDPRDWYRVYAAMTFDSSRETLRQRVDRIERDRGAQ